MRPIADWIITHLIGVTNPADWPYTWVVYLVMMVFAAVLAITFVALFAGPVTWVERRVAGRIMSRLGPNRVGPQGFLQWMADGRLDGRALITDLINLKQLPRVYAERIHTGKAIKVMLQIGDEF